MAPSEFVTITRTADDLSIVAADRLVPATTDAERGFAGLKVAGPLAFGEIGILASLASTLAAAGISIFVVSTYDTDYLLVKLDRLDAAVNALRHAGHHVSMRAEG